MRTSRVMTVLLVALSLTSSVALSTNKEADVEAITAILDQWNRGWASKNQQLAAAGYSDDADWTNAFGFYKKGRSAIEGYLAEVFHLPFVMAAESHVAAQDILFIAPEVATVRTQVERAGQRTPDGKPLGTRHTHHLRVFVKRGDQWAIVSHLISDARDPLAPQH